MSAASKPLPSRMTRDEFLAWDAPGPDRWQLVDGEAVAMAPTSLTHGALLAELGRLLGNHLLAAGTGCRVLIAPGVVPRLRAAMNHRIPNLGVTGAPPSQDYEMHEPVLLVEVLSPSNERDARANVWAYATIPSLREILLLRSSRVEAELLRRDADGDWPSDAQVIVSGGTLHLDSIGFTASLSDLYRTTGLTRSA